MPEREKGKIEVICGCMFSGKSEELLRRVKRAQIARQQVQVFKPTLDNRYGESTVNSHDQRSTDAVAVESADGILDLVSEDTVVVAVDEGQFFDDRLRSVCRRLADERNIRVIVAGLDLDFRGEPFAPMPDLMAEADDLDRLHAICVICGEDAHRTQRIIQEQQPDGNWITRPANYDDPLILVAADQNHAAEIGETIKEFYEARCRHCHDVPGKPLENLP